MTTDSTPNRASSPQTASPRGDRAQMDPEIIRGAKAGDVGAFEELVRTCLPRVLAVARSVVGKPSDAEDVAQAVFYKVYRKLDTFREDASFYTWLYRVTINAANDKLKERRKERSTQAEEFERLPVASANDDPASAAAREDLRDQVRLAVQELPEIFRDVVVLREAHGLSCEDVSATLGIPFGTVVSRLFRARTKLKAILKRRLRGADPFNSD